MSTPPSPKIKTSGCPLCGQATDALHAPFCSRGCKDRDLVNWLSDAYRVPGPSAEEVHEESAQSGLDIDR